MYAMNTQNDVIGLVLRENCKSKQMTDIIVWPSRCHGRIVILLFYFSVASLLDRFLSVCPQQKAQLEDEVQDHILTSLSDLPKYDPETSTLNQFWHAVSQMKLPSGSLQFQQLYQLSKVLLTTSQQCRYRACVLHAEEDTDRLQRQLKWPNHTVFSLLQYNSVTSINLIQMWSKQQRRLVPPTWTSVPVPSRLIST